MTADIFLSGRFTTNAEIEKAWLKISGCKHRCFSYAFVHKPGGLQYNKRVEAALHLCEQQKINIMMDSGAHSLHVISRSTAKRGENAKKKQAISVVGAQEKMFEEYCRYVHANKHLWTFYVTLDYERKQSVIYNMQKKFHAKGLAPVPVYHGDSELLWLKKHKDMGHNFICIGGATLHPGKGGLKYYFDNVFNFGAKHGLEFHGLAFTSLDIIMSYPFKSIDSSTWSKIAAFGMIHFPDLRRRKFYNVHVSKKQTSNPNSVTHMTKIQKDALAVQLAEHGFDLKEMRDSEDARHNWNGYVMCNLDKFNITQEPKKTWESLF
jgi:hypothetical protein